MFFDCTQSGFKCLLQIDARTFSNNYFPHPKMNVLREPEWLQYCIGALIIKALTVLVRTENYYATVHAAAQGCLRIRHPRTLGPT